MSTKHLLTLAVGLLAWLGASGQSWTADNGDGTYTNPLFYDEFSDPDIIRVGDDFYLAGTTMHCVPGVVILHSKDLVNWEFESYCMERFNLGPQFRLEEGREAYGQGIWAPCIRYHDGHFYVFSNINGVGMQVFISDSPRGPWEHKNLAGDIYDLSVLFDDEEGKIFAIHSYGEVKVTEIKPDFSGYVEGSTRTIIAEGNAMGEGHHAYKIDGKYYILSADYAPMGRMQCARADNIYGPYETCTVSQLESMGTPVVHAVDNVGLGSEVPGPDFLYAVSERPANLLGCATIHQGGLVSLPGGEWWAISMQDFRAVGRTVCLSPVTWHDGWPYFGLEGNLGRSPKTWLKPRIGAATTADGPAPARPHAPYERNGFTADGRHLSPVWQWNHEPVDGLWRLAGGKLRLTALPATDLLWARNTLTQRCMGPVSVTTVRLNAQGLHDGDAAGLALLNMPYAWLGVVKEGRQPVLTLTALPADGNRITATPVKELTPRQTLWLRVWMDLDADVARFSYSTDGDTFTDVGIPVLLPYQLKTFQGPRYSLFAFNRKGQRGGTAVFSDFTVSEPMADRSDNIPWGQTVALRNKGNGTYMAATRHGLVHSSPELTDDCLFEVIGRGEGQAVLKARNGMGFVTVVGQGLSADVRLLPGETDASRFMWQDLLRGDCMLLSMKTHRYVALNPTTGEPYSAMSAGTTPDRRDGSVFECVTGDW